MPKWTEVPHDIINGAHQRLWGGLGDRAEDIARRIIDDPTFAGDLVQFVIEYHTKTMGKCAEATTYKVADCFTNRSIFHHRDGNLDRWLPATLPVKIADYFSYKNTTQGQTFRQMAEMIAGISDIGDKRNEDLVSILVEQGKTCSLKQIENAIVRHEAGDKSDGLLDNGRANFFFVWSGSAMFVVRASWDGDRWDVDVYSFGRGYWWAAGCRVFFGN